MCIAIYKPQDRVLTADTLTNCWQRNADGAGFAYVDDVGEVHVMKGYMKLKALKKAMKFAGETREMIVHFRLATHGLTDQDNTHPFIVPGGAFCHNGVLSGKEFQEPVRSDTSILATDILTPLLTEHPRFGQQPHELSILNRYMGYNKGILLLNTGVVIMNEADGVWDSKCWFSNDGYKAATYQWIRRPYQAGYQTKRYHTVNDQCVEYGNDVYDDMDEWEQRWIKSGEKALDIPEDILTDTDPYTDEELLDMTDQELTMMGLTRKNLEEERLAETLRICNAGIDQER